MARGWVRGIRACFGWRGRSVVAGLNKDWTGKGEQPWRTPPRDAGRGREHSESRDAYREADDTQTRKEREGEWLEPVSGLHAVGSLFACKPAAVERLFFDAPTAPMLGELCKYLAKERKVYRQVMPDKLDRLAGFRGHGGVVAIARRHQPELATRETAAFWSREGMPLIILDGVKDARLLGGIARVAAFFGVEKLLLADSRRQVRPTAVSYRASRGGLEMLDVRLVENPPSFLKSIRDDFVVIGLDVEGAPLPEYLAICPEEKVGKPVALVIGDEEMGLAESTLEACEHVVSLPGSGQLDRLPVESEIALLLQRYVVEAF